MTVFDNAKIQYALGVDDEAGTLQRVTEDTSFNPSTDLKTYEPSYKDRVNQPVYTTGAKNSWEIDIDHVDGSAVQEFLYDIEDALNTETDLVRIDEFKPDSASGGFKAKKCRVSITMNQIDAEAEGMVKHTGTATMISDGWEHGTAKWDAQKKVCMFTPATTSSEAGA